MTEHTEIQRPESVPGSFDPGAAGLAPEAPAENGAPEPESRKQRKAREKQEKARARQERKAAKQQQKAEQQTQQQQAQLQPDQQQHEPQQHEPQQHEPQQHEPQQHEPQQQLQAAEQSLQTDFPADSEEPPPPPAPPAEFLRIGHKGADTIVEGNTIASFEAAVEAGADMVEFDVLRTRDGRLVVAHDYPDASRRRPLSLTEALDAFSYAPLDQVEIDCDLKLRGREAELAGAIAGHGLIDRAMISTMEVESLAKLHGIDPDLRLGWTLPKTRRDWTKDRWAKPVLGAGMAVLRRRLPGMIEQRAPEMGLEAVWVYHWLITRETLEAAERAGVELYAWTVDDPERVAELAELGVHGIVSNDPRILS